MNKSTRERIGRQDLSQKVPSEKGSLGVIFSPRNYRENAHSKSANFEGRHSGGHLLGRPLLFTSDLRCAKVMILDSQLGKAWRRCSHETMPCTGSLRARHEEEGPKGKQNYNMARSVLSGRSEGREGGVGSIVVGFGVFVLPALLQKFVSDFLKSFLLRNLVEISWEFCWMFSDPQNKGLKFSGRIGSIFCKKIRNSKNIFRANYALQT